jgi:hypothetical protein
MAFSGDPTKGIDISFSPSLHQYIQLMTGDNCQNLSQECFDSLEVAIADVSNTLDTRQLGAGVLLGSLAAGIVGILLGLFHLSKTDPMGLHLPPAQVSWITDMATASTIAVITATDAPAVTVTQHPTGIAPTT